jgi:glycopeptide antibiotics resistance protein
VNFIPFYFGTCEIAALCIYNIVGNILLTMPFGFGISFIVQFGSKNLLWLAFAVGFALESSQLVISLIYQSAFRSVDINDVILNAFGVVFGYGTFRLFGRLYSYVTDRFEIRHKYIFAYIYDVVHQKD